MYRAVTEMFRDALAISCPNYENLKEVRDVGKQAFSTEVMMASLFFYEKWGFPLALTVMWQFCFLEATLLEPF